MVTQHCYLLYEPGVWLGPCEVKVQSRRRYLQFSSQRILNTALGAASDDDVQLNCARVLEMRWHGSHVRALRCTLLQQPTQLTQCSS